MILELRERVGSNDDDAALRQTARRMEIVGVKIRFFQLSPAGVLVVRKVRLELVEIAVH
ncbi:hypothetical protein D3C87_2070970 [compost metagenome]